MASTKFILSGSLQIIKESDAEEKNLFEQTIYVMVFLIYFIACLPFKWNGCNQLSGFCSLGAYQSCKAKLCFRARFAGYKMLVCESCHFRFKSHWVSSLCMSFFPSNWLEIMGLQSISQAASDNFLIPAKIYTQCLGCVIQFLVSLTRDKTLKVHFSSFILANDLQRLGYIR